MIKIVSFADYIRAARKTAVFPTEPEGLYLKLGLRGEYGELCEKFKKLMRDGGWVPGTPIPDDKRQAIALELGDIMWYTCIRFYEDSRKKCSGFKYEIPKNSLLADVFPTTTNMFLESIDDLSVNINVLCSTFNFDSKKVNYMNHALRAEAYDATFVDVVTIAGYCGYSLLEICQMNIQKLASRQKRGKIIGSGDYR